MPQPRARIAAERRKKKKTPKPTIPKAEATSPTVKGAQTRAAAFTRATKADLSGWKPIKFDSAAQMRKIANFTIKEGLPENAYIVIEAARKQIATKAGHEGKDFTDWRTFFENAAPTESIDAGVGGAGAAEFLKGAAAGIEPTATQAAGISPTYISEKGQKLDQRVSNISTGYKRVTGNFPSPAKVIDLVNSGADGTVLDFEKLFAPVVYDKKMRNEISLSIKQAQAEALAAGRVRDLSLLPRELWGDFVAPGEPTTDLPAVEKFFSWTSLDMFLPGMQAAVEEEERLTAEWPAPRPVAEIWSALTAGQRERVSQVGTSEWGYEQGIPGEEVVRRYTLGYYILAALDGDEDATKRIWDTGYVPRGTSIRDWANQVLPGNFDQVTPKNKLATASLMQTMDIPGITPQDVPIVDRYGSPDEQKKSAIMQIAAAGRDPRMSEADWMAKFARTEWAPQVLKDNINQTIALQILGSAFAALGDVGFAQAEALTRQAQEAAEGQSASGDQIAAEAATVAHALHGVIALPMKIEEAAGIAGVEAIEQLKAKNPEEGDTAASRMSETLYQPGISAPSDFKVVNKVVFALANADPEIWEATKQAQVNLANEMKAREDKQVKESEGKFAAWQWAEAAGLNTQNEWIAGGVLMAELIFQGVLARGLDVATRGTINGLRKAGIVKEATKEIGGWSLKQVWLHCDNPFVIRQVSANSGVLMTMEDASHLARINSPEIMNEYLSVNNAITPLSGTSFDLATPSLAVFRKYARLMDTGRSARQRMWGLPMPGRILDLSPAMSPDFAVYEYAIYNNLGVNRAVKLASEMTDALAKNHPDGLSPMQVGEKVKVVIEKEYRNRPASDSYKRASQNKDATLWDEWQAIKRDQSARYQSEAAQQSFLPGRRGPTEVTIDAVWDRRALGELRKQEKVLADTIKNSEKEVADLRAIRTPQANLGPLRKLDNGTWVRDILDKDGNPVTNPNGTQRYADAGMAEVAGPIIEAGYPLIESHGFLRGVINPETGKRVQTHRKSNPAYDEPSYQIFESGPHNEAISAAAEKNGLKVESGGAAKAGEIPQRPVFDVDATFAKYTDESGRIKQSGTDKYRIRGELDEAIARGADVPDSVIDDVYQRIYEGSGKGVGDNPASRYGAQSAVEEAKQLRDTIARGEKPWFWMTAKEWKASLTLKEKTPAPESFSGSLVKGPLYHGSTTGEPISAFFTEASELGGATGARSAKLGAFFTTKARVAEDFAIDVSERGVVHAVRVNIRKPLVVKATMSKADAEAVVDVLVKAGKDSEPAARALVKAVRDGKNDPFSIVSELGRTKDVAATRKLLQGHGYDGIVVRTSMDVGKGRAPQVIVFNKANIHIESAERWYPGTRGEMLRAYAARGFPIPKSLVQEIKNPPSGVKVISDAEAAAILSKKPPAAQTTPSLIVKVEGHGRQAQAKWQAFADDLIDQAVPPTEAEGVAQQTLADARGEHQRLVESAERELPRTPAPMTDRQLANHIDWDIDARNAALLNSGLHTERIPAEQLTWERNLSVYEGKMLTPWYDLVNGLVPQLRTKPLPVVGKGTRVTGKPLLRSLETPQSGKGQVINRVTKARKMIALAKLSTIAIIIGADELMRTSIWALGANVLNGSITYKEATKSTLGIISKRFEEKGMTLVDGEIEGLFSQSPGWRDNFMHSLLGDKWNPTRINVDPGHPAFREAARQHITTFNASSGPNGSVILRQWYKDLVYAEEKYGYNNPRAFAYAKARLTRRTKEDPYFTQGGNEGYELIRMRAGVPYVKGQKFVPSLVNDWIDGIHLTAMERCQNPVTRRHFVTGRIKDSDFKNQRVAEVYGRIPLTADMATTHPSHWRQVRLTPRDHDKIAVRGTKHAVNTVVHPIDAMFEVLGGAGVRLKRESFAAFYRDAKKHISEKKPSISPEDLAYEAAQVAFAKTKSISYMAEHSFLEESLRNVVMFLPAYKQFAKFWGGKAMKNLWMTAFILSDLLEHGEEINKTTGDILDKTLGAVPGVKGGLKFTPLETTFFNLTDREGNFDLRQITPSTSLPGMDVLGFASIGSETARSWYEVLGGGYPPNAPMHTPLEAVMWSMLPDSLRSSYAKVADNLEGTGNLVDGRTKRTIMEMAKQHAAGQPIDYDKAIGSPNPFTEEFWSGEGVRGYERGVGFTRFTVPMRNQRTYGTMEVAPQMNNGKALKIDLARFNEGQRQFFLAQDAYSIDQVLEMYPEYKPVARAYQIQQEEGTNAQLEYLSKHRWVIPFVVTTTTAKGIEDYDGPPPILFSERQKARTKIDAKEVAVEIQGRIDDVDKYVLSKRYGQQMDRIEKDPRGVLKQYERYRQQRGRKDMANPLPDVDPAEIQAALKVRKYKGAETDVGVTNSIFQHLKSGLNSTFYEKEKKTLERVVPSIVGLGGDKNEDARNKELDSGMRISAGGQPNGWKGIKKSLDKLWDTGEEWAKRAVRESDYYPYFLATKREEADQRRDDQVTFALMGNRAGWLTKSENRDEARRVLRSVGFSGNNRVIDQQIDDLLPYLQAIDKVNRQIGIWAQRDPSSDQYRDALLQRDIQIEVLRERYPMLKLSTAEWIRDIGFEDFRFTHPDYEGLEMGPHLSRATIAKIRKWSLAELKVDKFNALSPKLSSQLDIKGYTEKWAKAYEDIDPKLRPALDELSRANAWYFVGAVFESTRKALLEAGVKPGSDKYERLKEFMDGFYAKMRTASPVFAAEVDEVFGKRDFVSYMIDPRRESTRGIRSQKVEQAVEAGVRETRSTDSLVSFAKALQGTPYLYASDDIDNGGVDCSGYIAYVFRHAGGLKDFPTFTGNQYPLGQSVTKDDPSKLQPGDLIFVVTGSPHVSEGGTTDDYGFGHVGLYTGDGQVVHSSSGGVQVESLATFLSSYSAWEARRYKLRIN